MRPERERLIEHIDGLVRLHLPRGKWSAFLEFRARLLKTSLPVLREISDVDIPALAAGLGEPAAVDRSAGVMA